MSNPRTNPDVISPVEAKSLRNAVEFMDSLSQDGFSQICSIAKLALSRLETPEGHRHIDNIADALKAIWRIAEDAEGCINNTAESVGCSYVDEAARRLMDAARQAHKRDRRAQSVGA